MSHGLKVEESFTLARGVVNVFGMEIPGVMGYRRIVEMMLELKSTALVLIDLQYGIVTRPWAPYAAHEVVTQCAALAKAVRKRGGMVVFVRVLVAELPNLPVDAPGPRRSAPLPDNACDLVPETDVQPGDLLLTKRQWGAFYGTELDEQLRRCGVKTIILGGIATNFGVESTARAAFDRGYELVFAEDAMTSFSAEAHDFTVMHIFPRMGRVRSVEQLIVAMRH